MTVPISDLEWADVLLDHMEDRFSHDWADATLDDIGFGGEQGESIIAATRLEELVRQRINSSRWEVEQRVKAIRQRIAEESEAERARAAELIGEEHVDKAGNFP